MTLPRSVIVLSFLLGVTFSSRAALADVPGPRSECDVEGQGCESCWQHYGESQEDAEAFKKCSEPLVAKGLVEACRHRQGAGDAVYFCPAGTKVGKTVRGGGCGACAMDPGEASTALGAGALGLGLLAMLRRRSRRK